MFSDFGLRIDWNRLGTCIYNAPCKARKCAYFPNARAICTFLLNPPLRLQKGVIPAADLGSSTRGVNPAADPGSDPKLAPSRPGLGSPTSATASPTSTATATTIPENISRKHQQQRQHRQQRQHQQKTSAKNNSP